MSPFGAKTLSVPSLWSAFLHYGTVAPNGEVPVGLAFDHRVMDGAVVGYTLMEMEQALHHDIVAELRSMRGANGRLTRGATDPYRRRTRMTKQDALRLLEETLELRPHTLTGGESSREVEGWDSMSTMAFIAMADQEFGLPLPGNQVAACQTVDELLGLLGASATSRAA